MKTGLDSLPITSYTLLTPLTFAVRNDYSQYTPAPGSAAALRMLAPFSVLTRRVGLPPALTAAVTAAQAATFL